MQASVITAILGILVPLWVLLRRDFIKGLAFAIFFWVSMTTYLRIELPGALPALTIHRLMLIVVVAVWLTRHRLKEALSIPLFGCFVFWSLASLISLFGTQIEFATSLKRFLDFVLEVFVFYVVAYTSLRNKDDALRLLHAAWLGLIVVAVFAVIEKETGFNPVDRFIPGYQRDEGDLRMILSTYQHRILLGAAMAMGVPLSFALFQAYAEKGKRLRFFWPALALLLTASYFGFSRGPWLGLILGCSIVFFTGSARIRRTLVLVGIVGVVVLIARPGVVDTLSHFVHDTVDKDSFKGGTAQYRLELWRVAFFLVCRSPWTFLFGYGPGVGSEMSIDWELSYRGKEFVIDSWDNQFAYALFQFGFIGLASTLLLYCKGLIMMFKATRNKQNTDCPLIGCLCATGAVLLWMMTNVLIFAKQIDYLFWTVIAAGICIVLAPRSAPAVENAELSSEQQTESTTEGVYSALPGI